MGDRRKFAFSITYFKPNGKFYTNTGHSMECDSIGEFKDSPYMNDAVDEIRRLRSESKLPGLQSGYWEGYILIEHELGVPHLITPYGHDL